MEKKHFIKEAVLDGGTENNVGVMWGKGRRKN